MQTALDKGCSQEIRVQTYCIWRHVPSKNGPSQQSKLAPESEMCRDFWQSFFYDGDPLDDIVTDEVDELDVGLLPLDITGDDVKEAFHLLKNKAPGRDDIRLMVIKTAASPDLWDELARLYTFEANKKEPLPPWMRTGVGRLIYKNKGTRKDPSNYRLIILAPLLAKLYEKILEQKGNKMVKDGILRVAVEQGGFMAGRSTFDSVFLLESLRDGQKQSKKGMYAGFLDLRKAFDSVNHKKLLRVLTEQGAHPGWIKALKNMLVKRKMELYDHFFYMLKGTAQGSPISPQLFILFINPLIERLKAAGRGIHLADDRWIRGLLFADDICLTAESLEDLKVMLDICEQWANDYGMSFNTAKCEIMQLAGKVPEVQPVVAFAGGELTWVKTFKYLGVHIFEGRKRIIPSPRPKMFKAFYRISEALGSKKNLPLLPQVYLAQATILNAVLYPCAVQDTDYRDIDRFLARAMNRITGCTMRWTSSTFLRAELGLPPSKYLAHRRALNFLWHIENTAWFGNYLPYLKGPGPYKRLLNIAHEYEIDVSEVRKVTKDAWSNTVKKAVMEKAAEEVSRQLASRGLPPTEPLLKCRPYVRLGGFKAMFGVQYRWRMLKHRHPDFGGALGLVNDDRRLQWLGEQGAIRRCNICLRWHRPKPAHVADALRCPLFVPSKLRQLRAEVFNDMMTEMGHSNVAPGSNFYGCMDTLCWNKQTRSTTKKLLDLMMRLIQHQQKKERRSVKRITALFVKYIRKVRHDRLATLRGEFDRAAI